MANLTNVAEIEAALAAPFYADEIEWKIQSFNKQKTKALIVPFVDARAIMNRLDEVLGITNWMDEYSAGPDGGVKCRLSLRINGEWLSKEDGADNADIGGSKAGYSNALKRAAVKWKIGRYLYDAPMQWYDLDEHGKPKQKPQLPRQFLPADADASGNRPKKATEGRKTQRAAAPQEEKAVKTPKPEVKEEVIAKKPVTPINMPAEDAPEEEWLEWAKAQLVPDGYRLPYVGKPLADAASAFPEVVQWLTGNVKRANGTKFEPKNEAEEAIKRAATILAATLPNGKKK